MTFDFKDGVVLVTGAAAGIGHGIAQAFHQAGARVALGDVREAALKRAAAALGPDVFSGVVDVRDAAEVSRFVAEDGEGAAGPVTGTIANTGDLSQTRPSST